MIGEFVPFCVVSDCYLIALLLRPSCVEFHLHPCLGWHFLFILSVIFFVFWRGRHCSSDGLIIFYIFLITGYYEFAPQGWNSLSNSLITSIPTQKNPPHSLIAFNPAEGGNLYHLVLQGNLLGQRHKLTHVCVCAEQEIWTVAHFIFEVDNVIWFAPGEGSQGERKWGGRGEEVW